MAVAISNFVQHIEDNIYKKSLIYRSIIVAKNDKECLVLKRQLENKDYSAIVVDCIKYDIDYNNIDNRIVIIDFEKFKTFIEYLDQYNGGIFESTYNFIAFSYYIEDNIVDDLVAYYIKKTNNNMNNTIILEKNYSNFLYFQQCMS